MKNFEVIKDSMQKREAYLSEYACKSKYAIRKEKNNEDIRLDFSRDCDRIIHSSAYTRYMKKTQVFTNVDNDNISTRMTHVQFVSRASRVIARALNLNEDLCEAIALGHDVGHTPFGHVGEHILNEISKKELGIIFAHNLNSVRILDKIENNGKGCNLSLQVLDGIMSHNGEMVSKEYYPMKKDFKEFEREYNEALKDEMYIKTIRPMTLEGCVVRVSDIIGYIGKDIDDAVKLGILDINQIDEDIRKRLGENNQQIMNSIIIDIIEQSYEKPYIQMSDEVSSMVVRLKKFNSEMIYQKANTKEDLELYSKMFNKLYEVYKKALYENDTTNDIYSCFYNKMSDSYKEKNSKEQVVIDYLSGMTDKFIIEQYEKYIEKI